MTLSNLHILLALTRLKNKLGKMFDLKEYLNRRSRMIDATLDQVMPKSGCRPAILHKAMRYSVFSGGKRIRPILCLAAAEVVGSSYRRALLPAAAIELLHTYTLVHDDLPCMDNDDFRRGKPTVHKKFGEANAVLAGDALQALAFKVIARTPTASASTKEKLVSELAQAAGSTGIIGGQVEDLAAISKKQTQGMIDFIHRHKTADLFNASLRMGALSGEADTKQIKALTTYGKNVGLAFQIMDDLLDESQPGTRSGVEKPELTCLSILTPEEARRKAEALIHNAVSALQGLKSRLQPLISIAQFVINRTY